MVGGGGWRTKRAVPVGCQGWVVVGVIARTGRQRPRPRPHAPVAAAPSSAPAPARGPALCPHGRVGVGLKL